MAPKLANPVEVPPSASSDEEEDVTSSGEEEESSTEGEQEEEEPQTPLTQNNPPPNISETATPSVAKEDTEESGSESESESDTPIQNVNSIATKPMVVKTSSSSKRPAESSQSQQQEEAKEAKRTKKEETEEEGSSMKTPAGGGEDAKKNFFQRLFSEEDEIALLKGMLDYYAMKGTDPFKHMNAFFEFVKKSIHTDVTKAQVMLKIRRLKKKFENNACKGKEGEDPNFSKAHELNAFNLSKKIWDKEGISRKVESSAAKSNGKAKGNNKAIIALKAAESGSSPNKKVVNGAVTSIKMEVDDKDGSNSSGSFFDKKFGVGSLEEEILKHGFDMVDAGKKASLEARWRNLQIREVELFVERNEMVKDLAKSMLESYKSEDK